MKRLSFTACHSTDSNRITMDISKYKTLTRQYIKLKKKYQNIFIELQKMKEENQELKKKLSEISDRKDNSNISIQTHIQENNELKKKLCKASDNDNGIARENTMLRKKIDQLKRQSINIVEKSDEKKKTEEYEVEALIAHRKRKPNREFLVHWKGYSADESSWEKEQNLCCPTILNKYLKKNRLA